MLRVQIQLTDEQAQAIKRIASAKGVSVAEVIRRAVEGVIKTSPKADMKERQKQALDIVGKFRSGKRDISKRHDAYLAEGHAK